MDCVDRSENLHGTSGALLYCLVTLTGRQMHIQETPRHALKFERRNKSTLKLIFETCGSCSYAYLDIYSRVSKPLIPFVPTIPITAVRTDAIDAFGYMFNGSFLQKIHIAIPTNCSRAISSMLLKASFISIMHRPQMQRIAFATVIRLQIP